MISLGSQQRLSGELANVIKGYEISDVDLTCVAKRIRGWIEIDLIQWIQEAKLIKWQCEMLIRLMMLCESM